MYEMTPIASYCISLRNDISMGDPCISFNSTLAFPSLHETHVGSGVVVGTKSAPGTYEYHLCDLPGQTLW